MLPHGRRVLRRIGGSREGGLATGSLARVRSRRLANAVASEWLADGQEEETIRQWIAGHSVSELRSRFDAAPTELSDLLNFARTPGAQAIAELLNGDAVEFSVVAYGASPSSTQEATLARQRDTPPPAPIEVSTADGLVGVVGSSDHADAATILDMSIPLRAVVKPTSAGTRVEVSIRSRSDSQLDV